MSLLRTIESRISQAVEGAFGKVFRSNVQPVELARRLVKEMDDHQQRTVRRVYVPNVYELFLSPDDYRQFKEYEVALTVELAEYLAEHARRSGYALVSRPKVTLHRDRDLDLGSFGIATRMEQAADGAAPDDAADDPAPQPAVSKTMIYRPAAPPAAAAAAAGDGAFGILGPGGPFPLSGERVTIGRGKSNQVVVPDASVSREHAEVLRGRDGFVVRDLGSTNGVLVNGAKVQEHALLPGDRILLGNVELRFDRLAAGGDG